MIRRPIAGLLLASLLCSTVHAGFFKNNEPARKPVPAPVRGKTIFSENFNDVAPTDTPAKTISVGPVQFYSDKSALSIVTVGKNDQALNLVGTWVRFPINPISLGTGQALQLQFNITYPKGPVDDKQSLRFGFYNLQDITNTGKAFPEDQGIGVFTVPTADAATGKTNYSEDQNTADHSGKFPGFLGGGPGSRQNSDKCGSVNFETGTALVSLTISPLAVEADGKNPSWQMDFSVKVGAKTFFNRHVFGSAADFEPSGFNTVGIRIAQTESANIDNIKVSLLKLTDLN